MILTFDEVANGSVVGILRQVEAMKKGLKQKHGMKEEDGWVNHVDGACGEVAVAKFLGIPWGATVNTFKGCKDVGPCEVRTRRYLRQRHSLDLIVRDDDDDLDPFVHVISHLTGLGRPLFELVGWAWGGDCKRPEFRKGHGDREEAWFVPARFLQPIETLKASMYANVPPPVAAAVEIPWELVGAK